MNEKKVNEVARKVFGDWSFMQVYNRKAYIRAQLSRSTSVAAMINNGNRKG